MVYSLYHANDCALHFRFWHKDLTGHFGFELHIAERLTYDRDTRSLLEARRTDHSLCKLCSSVS